MLRGEIILRRVDAKPANRGFAVFHGCREGSVSAQAVIERGCGITCFQELRHVFVSLITAHKAAAMNHDHQWELAALLGNIQIQLLPGVAVVDVSKVTKRLRAFRQHHSLTERAATSSWTAPPESGSTTRFAPWAAAFLGRQHSRQEAEREQRG